MTPYELMINTNAYLIQDMVARTLTRLQTTCFGYKDDGVGECFDASLVVLRFLAAVAPDEEEWIQSRIDNYLQHCDDKKRSWFSQWYYWLCLSELPLSIATPQLDKARNNMLIWLQGKKHRLSCEQEKILQAIKHRYFGMA